MISNEAGQQLHDRATRGQPLSAEERTILDAWYAQQDTAETEQWAVGQLTHEISLPEQMKNILTRMTLLVQKMEESIAESKQLNDELAALYEQSLETEVADVRQAYPLMDSVARQEGWDDPEMDSYNIYSRKPHQ